MAELPDNKNQEEPSSYTPASPVKRIIAWVGVVYMLIFVALNLYPFFLLEHRGYVALNHS